MNPEKDVLVFLESSGEAYHEINVGLLTEGCRIAYRLEGSLRVLSIEESPESTAVLEDFGAETLYQLSGEGLSEYRCETVSWAIGTFLQTASPRLFLLAHSDRGRELSPRVACHLKTACVLDCVDIRVYDGRLIFVKSVYGRQFDQDMTFTSDQLHIATFRPELLDVQKPPGGGRLEVVDYSVPIPPEMILTRHLETIAPVFSTVDIVHAKRIVGAGMGTVDEDLQHLVLELAELLEGSLGGTRPVVDEGRMPKERMIGQTGKRVAPELYLALGISGSPHHVAGIQDAKRILSVDRDPRAPIYRFSDVGFIADLKKVLPGLIRRILDWKEGRGDEIH